MINNRVLSIDPSILNSGIAIFENRNVVNVYSCNGYELVLLLEKELSNIDYVVFEASNLQKAVWGKNMRCVGQVDAVCNLIRQAIKHHNKLRKKEKRAMIILQEVSPLQKGKKIPYVYMQEAFPHFKITQDISDAIKIGEWFCMYGV